MEDRNKKIKAPLEFPINIKRTIITDGKSEEKLEEVSELSLGRLTLNVFRDLPIGSIGSKGEFAPSAFLPLIAASASIPIDSAEQIDFRDMEIIMESMSPFLPKSL